MTGSAMALGILGAILTFMPHEVTAFFKVENNQLNILTLQILGALYLGFAILNWMSKNNIIGGVFGKPLLIGNLIHFVVSAVALLKVVLSKAENHYTILLALSLVYCVLALSFASLFFSSPKK